MLCSYFIAAIAAQGIASNAADSEQVQIRSAPYFPPGAVISVQSTLVELGAVVRNRKGQPLGGLTAGDFVVLDNGSPQAITAFLEQKASRDSALEAPVASQWVRGAGGRPSDGSRRRYIALFFDDTHTGLFGIHRSKEAAEKLVTMNLEPGDHVAIFTDSGSVAQDFTQNKVALLAAIARLRPNHVGVRGGSVCPSLTPLQAYSIAKRLDQKAKEIAVREAIACNCSAPQSACKGCAPVTDTCAASQQDSVQMIAESFWGVVRNQSSSTLDVVRMVLRRLSEAPGERILIMVSSGFISGDAPRQMDALIEMALRSHIVIHALNAEGLVDRDQRVNDLVRDQVLSEFMATASIATGGEMIHNTNDLTGGLRTLARSPEVRYLFGFSPSAEPDDTYHPLKVRLRNCAGCVVESRRGYYAAVANGRAETVQDRIDREVVSNGTINELPAAVRVRTGIPNNDRVPIRVDIHLDLKGLQFREQNGRHIQQVTFVTVVQDSTGGFVDGKQAVMDLFLTPEKLLGMQATGLNANVSFSLPRGSFRVRQIVREAVQNQWAALTTPFEVQ